MTPAARQIAPKYQQIARGIEEAIQDGVLKKGDKLPSVRQLCQQYGISMGTAFQTYYCLESKGLITARPKSGYYVQYNYQMLPVPAFVKPQTKNKEVSTKQMIRNVFENLNSKEIINFSAVVPQLQLLPVPKLSKSVIKGMHISDGHGINYEEMQGNAELRKQIARMALNWNGKIKPEDIIITNGCIEALYVSLSTLTQPGDAVAIESPTYFGLFQLLETLRLKAVEIPTNPEQGPDLNFLDNAIRRFKIKCCVFVPNFHNPLGYCMSDEKKQNLVYLLKKHKIPLIEDDIYGDLYFVKNRPTTCKSFDKEGWVIYCSSISKSLAPGYRIGWCIPGKFAEEIKTRKIMTTISTCSLSQNAIRHFLEVGRYNNHINKLRHQLQAQYHQYLEAIIQYFGPDIKVSRPAGGLVLWIELNKGIDAGKLYYEAIRHQISFAPGQIFSSQGNYKHCIRIGYGRSFDAKTDRGLKILGSLIKRF